MTESAAIVPERAGRREWVGLAVLTLAVGVYVMDLTVLHIAVPQLSADLRPSAVELLWIIDVYGFVVAGSLITMGTIGDRIGRRRLLMIGAAAFAAVSIIAAFSVSSSMLIATRALMGLAGATLAPSTLSLIFVMFKDRRQRSVAIGIWVAAFSAGSAVGPVAGGLLVEHYWWGSVFLLAVPVMALLLVLGPRTLPEYRDPNASRMDLPSAALALTAVLAGIFAMKELAQDGPGSPVLVATLFALVLAVVFVRRQRALEDPIVDLDLFRNRGFSVAIVVNATTIFIIAGYFLFVAQYLQLVIGLSPFEAGLWTVPSAAGYILGSTVSSRYMHRIRPGLLTAVSMGFGAAGLLWLTRVGVWGELSTMVPATVVVATALSPLFNLTTEMIVGSAPPENAGVASGIAETGTELGASFGLAVLGSVGAAVYRSEIASNVPAGIDSSVVDAIRNTLGGAADAVAGLPAETADALLLIAQDAFAGGLRIAAATGAALAVVVGIVSSYLLRDAPPPSLLGAGEPDPPPEGA